MFKIIDLATAPTVPMENGRGETALLVDQSVGADKIDLHLNRLVPGGPNGSLHRHSQADNVYIVKRGEGTLTVEGETRLVHEDDVIFIPAGMKHSLSNLGSEVFEIFEIYAPAGAHFDFVLDE